MQISRVFRRWCVTLTLLAGAISPAYASFSINLSFAGLTPSQVNIFHTARMNWESLITGYQPGIALTGITIAAFSTPIDGVGRILGSADPTAFRTQGGFTLSTEGAMYFDSADLADMERTGELEAVVMHEIAHVMGFGTLWTANDVYVNGTGRYTGANALNTYRAEYDPTALFIPVELKYWPGTNDAHWEDDLTTIRDRQGRPLSSELMTGFIDYPTHLSETTIQSFVDIGFTARIAGTIAAPEPTTLGLFAVGAFGVMVIARRRARQEFALVSSAFPEDSGEFPRFLRGTLPTPNAYILFVASDLVAFAFCALCFLPISSGRHKQEDVSFVSENFHTLRKRASTEAASAVRFWACRLRFRP